MNHDMIQVLLTFAHYFVPIDMFRKLKDSLKKTNFSNIIKRTKKNLQLNREIEIRRKLELETNEHISNDSLGCGVNDATIKIITHKFPLQSSHHDSFINYHKI